MRPPNLCSVCRHLTTSYSGFGVDTCPAYPTGIPLEIREGRAPHFDVRPDQTGATVFLSKPGQYANKVVERIRNG